MKYRLHFLNGQFAGKRFSVGDGRMVIGRFGDCQIDLQDDDHVSRQHAAIEAGGDRVVIKDLGAQESIVVNGARVNEAELSDGDTIEIGRTKIRFEHIRPRSTYAGRRVGPTQLAAYAILSAVVLAQVVYLIYLATWWNNSAEVRSFLGRPQVAQESEQGVVSEAEPAPEVTPAEPPPPAPKEEAETAPAEAPMSEMTATRLAAEGKVPMQPIKLPGLPEGLDDPVVARAKTMLKNALKSIAANELEQADFELERIQVMAPDFVPAHIERARLFERRQMLKEAEAEWGKVLDRAEGTPSFETAAAERIRLSRAIKAEAMRKRLVESTKTVAPTLPRRVRIADIARDKFQSSEDFDEMRLLRIKLSVDPGETAFDGSQVRVRVVFFDQALQTEELGPSRAVAPAEPLRVDGPWAQGEEQSVTAAYIVPRGFRDKEEAEYGLRRRFYGYAVQVYYKGQLQDAAARPAALVREIIDQVTLSGKPLPSAP